MENGLQLVKTIIFLILSHICTYYIWPTLLHKNMVRNRILLFFLAVVAWQDDNWDGNVGHGARSLIVVLLAEFRRTPCHNNCSYWKLACWFPWVSMQHTSMDLACSLCLPMLSIQMSPWLPPGAGRGCHRHRYSWYNIAYSCRPCHAMPCSAIPVFTCQYGHNHG